MGEIQQVPVRLIFVLLPMNHVVDSTSPNKMSYFFEQRYVLTFNYKLTNHIDSVSMPNNLQSVQVPKSTSILACLFRLVLKMSEKYGYL